MMTTTELRLAVLVSGDGSNLQALIDAIESGVLKAKIVFVFSNNQQAFALTRAANHNIPSEVIDHKQFAERSDFDRAMANAIQAYHPDLLVLAGFMRILTSDFIDHFQQRMLNIHPSLLPKFQGLHTHRQALAAGEQEHGVSVHYVTEDLDAGPVIGQAVLTINTNDNELTLKKRVQKLEHVLYPRCIQLLAEGRIEYRHGKVYFDGEETNTAPLVISESKQ